MNLSINDGRIGLSASWDSSDSWIFAIFVPENWTNHYRDSIYFVIFSIHKFGLWFVSYESQQKIANRAIIMNLYFQYSLFLWIWLCIFVIFAIFVPSNWTNHYGDLIRFVIYWINILRRFNSLNSIYKIRLIRSFCWVNFPDSFVPTINRTYMPI